MGDSEQQQQADAAIEEIPANVKADIKEFLRLDDGLKQARLEMKQSRDALNQHKDSIIQYMKLHKVDKMSARKGEATLLLQQKTLKIKPNAECVRNALEKAMRDNVTDPSVIYEIISSCGGEEEVWRLARRAKRVQKPKEKK